MVMHAMVVYLSFVVAMSLICFATYAYDKRQALNGGWRVSERTLHLLEFFGGWPGALLGQRFFRHKTKKLSFLVVFWLLVILHISILGATIYWLR